MPIINQAIAAVWGGVSQQAAALRQPSQAEASDNFYPTVADGITFRPPLIHAGTLPGSVGGYATFVTQGKGADYVLHLPGDGTVRMASLANPSTLLTVTQDANSTAYLTSASAQDDFTVLCVSETIFILNKSVKVQKEAQAAPSANLTGYTVFKYAGAGVQRKITFKVTHGAGVYTSEYSGAATGITAVMDAIISGYSLQSSLFTVTKLGNNILKFTPLGNPSTFKVESTDDYGNACTLTIQGSVRTFGDLPPGLDDGYVCYVSPDPAKQGKGFYVKYVASANAWQEVAAPSAIERPSQASMPIRVVKTGAATFKVEQIPWKWRGAGDAESCPTPSFVGYPIQDIFFHRDRLGFVSGESVVMSCAGDYWNFYPKTAQSVVDDDPIDISAGSADVASLLYAVPFNKALMLFSTAGQLQLTAPDALTPKTARVDPVTSFEVSLKCRPQAVGNNLYFASTRGGYTQLREYYVQMDALSNDAADVTTHVPRYIPDGTRWIASSTADDLLILGDGTRTLYGYKYLWNGEGKVQSAWFRWLLPSNCQALAGRFIRGVLWLVCKYAGDAGLAVESITPAAAGTDHLTDLTAAYLDRRTASAVAAQDFTGGYTRFPVPWAASGLQNPSAVPPPVAVITEGPDKGLCITGQWTFGGPQALAVFLGDYRAGGANKAVIGHAYTATYRLSEQFYRDTKGEPQAASVVKIRRMLFQYLRSRAFRIKVTPVGRATATHTFAGSVLGVYSPVSSNSFFDGTVTIPVMSDTRGVTIDIVVDTPAPATFQRIEWEGEAVLKANRQ